MSQRPKESRSLKSWSMVFSQTVDPYGTSIFPAQQPLSPSAGACSEMWFFSSFGHYSWSSHFSCKTQQTCKSSTENGPEMKHIPLSLGLCFQKRRGKFICAKTVKLYSSSPPIAKRSKVREGSIPRHAADARGQGDTGDQAANGAVLFSARTKMQSDGDPILSYWP